MRRLIVTTVGTLLLAVSGGAFVRGQATPIARQVETLRSLSPAECSVERLGSDIPPSSIGEPVSTVSLHAPVWIDATADAPAHCSIAGAMAPAGSGDYAQPLNFRVVLPATWNGRAVQMGGGGMNGRIPNLTGPIDGGPSGLVRQVVTYGSDSGHQMGRDVSTDWTLDDEAIQNLGYMQMKKTHDAAMAIVERAYGTTPTFSYYVGGSQGGREALTVAQRYPDDYDGIISNVPIVGFSSLMLAPELIRIQEKPLANWVTPAKAVTVADHFMRTCDDLDGRVDGVINNYMACRSAFDVTDDVGGQDPWLPKRCPNGIDPDPSDAGPDACLTDGQIDTLEFTYSPYRFATPLANGVDSFGMWVPNTDPSGSGLIERVRYVGQEGAAPDAETHAHLGVLGVTGFLMRDTAANPLDYIEGGALNERRIQLSGWLDSTDPDLSDFRAAGGKLIVTIGTDDTLASPGAQLDYYQSVIETMGREAVDSFARFFVMPQANHGLRARTAARDGNGNAIDQAPLPTTIDRMTMLFDWVERGSAPAQHAEVSGDGDPMPLCSYPAYPHYENGTFACRE